MIAPRGPCDTDCAHRILGISHDLCSVPCKQSQGHPWSFIPDHIHIVFRKILFSPRWEPVSAGGWGGWGGVRKGLLFRTELILQGAS